MFITADQITASNQAAFDTSKALAAKTYSGFEKLVELNMAAAKALMTESFSHAQAALRVVLAALLSRWRAAAARTRQRWRQRWD